MDSTGPRNHVLDGGPDPPCEGAILRGTFYVKLNYFVVLVVATVGYSSSCCSRPSNSSSIVVGESSSYDEPKTMLTRLMVETCVSGMRRCKRCEELIDQSHHNPCCRDCCCPQSPRRYRFLPE